MSILFGDTEKQVGLLIISTELAPYSTHQMTRVKKNWIRVIKHAAE
ncbi:MAG: hypothetical protein Q8K74_08780 [Candidatus Nitrotoga sp.]|nr:hypothetical protein [Candidatus Nitrotoga sp.]